MNLVQKHSADDKAKVKSKKIKKVAHYKKPELIKANDEVASNFISFFDSLIKTNPSFVYHSNQNFQEKTNSSKENNKIVNPLREELVFGLNSIMRKIKNKKVIGVVLNHPLTVHIQETLNDLCETYYIPFLIVPGLDKLEKILCLSSVTCLGFTSKVFDINSVCNQVFQLFKSHASQILENKNDFQNLENIKNTSINSSASKDVFFKFDIPSLNELYIYKNDENQITSSVLHQYTEEDNLTSFPCDEAFILINDKADDLYFPERPYFNNQIEINLNLNKLSDNQSVEDKNFAQKLINTSTLSQSYSNLKSSRYKYQEPKLVYLEPSKKKKR